MEPPLFIIAFALARTVADAVVRLRSIVARHSSCVVRCAGFSKSDPRTVHDSADRTKLLYGLVQRVEPGGINGNVIRAEFGSERDQAGLGTPGEDHFTAGRVQTPREG
jgi:hypothetical protein